ncbi:hypothetical protein QLX08_005861 [Tetragonisca angustula]|uniref:Uncharacterized protein n=1 Tax=Tetragonisca angustula TaxID=166442 RepID=A0AAW0ZY86_9HYME
MGSRFAVEKVGSENLPDASFGRQNLQIEYLEPSITVLNVNPKSLDLVQKIETSVTEEYDADNDFDELPYEMRIETKLETEENKDLSESRKGASDSREPGEK